MTKSAGKLFSDANLVLMSCTAVDYFYAGDANALQAVYTKLSAWISTETNETEISGLLALLAAMLVVISASLSLLWFNRIA